MTRRIASSAQPPSAGTRSNTHSFLCHLQLHSLLSVPIPKVIPGVQSSCERKVRRVGKLPHFGYGGENWSSAPYLRIAGKEGKRRVCRTTEKLAISTKNPNKMRPRDPIQIKAPPNSLCLGSLRLFEDRPGATVKRGFDLEPVRSR